MKIRDISLAVSLLHFSNEVADHYGLILMTREDTIVQLFRQLLLIARPRWHCTVHVSSGSRV